MFCINCDTNLPDGCKFCPKCGKPTHDASSPEAAPSSCRSTETYAAPAAPSRATSKHRLKPMLIISAIAVILLASCLMLPKLFGENRQPADPVDSLMDFFISGDEQSFLNAIQPQYLQALETRYNCSIQQLLSDNFSEYNHYLGYRVEDQRTLEKNELRVLQNDLETANISGKKVGTAIEYDIALEHPDKTVSQEKVICYQYSGHWYLWIGKAVAVASASTDAANLRSAKAVITIGVLDGSFEVGDTVTAEQCGILPKSKTDGGEFRAVIEADFVIKVYYGDHDIAYYANLAEEDSTIGTASVG